MSKLIRQNVVSCLGYSSTKSTNFSGNIDSDSEIGIDEHPRVPSLFEEDNYKVIINLLDNGFYGCQILIDSMVEYQNILENDITKRRDFSQTWTTRIKNQSSLSSYNTTKRAQFILVATPEKYNEQTNDRIKKIQRVIQNYQANVNAIYPSSKLQISERKHRQSKTIKNRFKSVYKAVETEQNTLEKLRNKRSNLNVSLGSLRNASNPPKSIKTDLAEIKLKLETVNKDISACKTRLERAKQIYRTAAVELYNECRELERERLDEMQQVMIKFAKAAFSSAESSQQNRIYQEALVNIENEQNTTKDLDKWAMKHGILNIDLGSSSTSISRKRHLKSGQNTVSKNANESESDST